MTVASLRIDSGHRAAEPALPSRSRARPVRAVRGRAPGGHRRGDRGPRVGPNGWRPARSDVDGGAVALGHPDRPRAHPVADPARGDPDQGEPDVRPHVRPVPRRGRRHHRQRPRRLHPPDPAAPDPPRGSPARLDRLLRRRRQRRDGRLRPGRSPDHEVRLLADASGADPELLAMGRRLPAVGQLLRLPPRPVAAEPPVPDRRAVRERDPRAGRHAHQAVEAAGKDVGMRRPAGGAGGGPGPRGQRGQGRPLLRLPDRGRPADEGGDRLGLLLGQRRPAGLHLVDVRLDPPRTAASTDEIRAASTPPPRTTGARPSGSRSRCTRRGSSPRSRG